LLQLVCYPTPDTNPAFDIQEKAFKPGAGGSRMYS
jgi:hypothetical protein